MRILGRCARLSLLGPNNRPRSDLVAAAACEGGALALGAAWTGAGQERDASRERLGHAEDTQVLIVAPEGLAAPPS